MKIRMLFLLAILFLSSIANAQLLKTSVPYAGTKTGAQISSLRCARLGTFVWNTTTSTYNICSAIGTPGTWAAIGGGGGFSPTLGIPVYLQDSAYEIFAGTAIENTPLLSNASNDNIQNNAGLITTSTSFTGFSNDLKITASGAAPWHIGFFNQIRSGGTYTGSGYLIGMFNFVNNRGNLTATPRVYGIQSDINLEGPATEAIGIYSSVYRGSAVANPIFTGGKFEAANGYLDADSVTGVEGFVRTVSTGATVTLARGGWSHVTTTAGHTLTSARGYDVSSWVNGGSIGTTYGYYLDNSHNVGTVANWAFYSLSTAPSQFSGQVNVSGRVQISGSGNYFAVGDTSFGDIFGTGAGVIQFPASQGLFLRDNGGNRGFMVGGSSVASAASIQPTGTMFHVTGTTNITSVIGTIGGFNIINGTEITIIFDGVLTFTDGSNLKLNGNFVTTADDSITLKFDGTNWYEISRSTN